MKEVAHIILVGAGGCMRELVWQIQELNKVCPKWHIDGYVDAKVPENESGCSVGGEWIPYLGTDDYLLAVKARTNVAVCVGNPNLRKKIVEVLRGNPCLVFPNLILGNTSICEDVKMGEGCIISMDAKISTNAVLGEFVFLNTGSMICHDGCVGDFVTLSPNVTLAGNVVVGKESEIGMGANVIQGSSIGERAVIGAGAVVVRDIEAGETAVGIPARKIKG